MSIELFYTPTSCGAASVIAATIGGIFAPGSLEGATASGVPVKAFEADIRAHKVVATGEDFYAINAKGNVPCLVVKDGEGKVVLLLNEGAAVLQYLGDHSPNAAKIVPAAGTNDRYAVANKLNWLASELHKSYGPLFNPALDEAGREKQREVVYSKIEYLLKHEAPAPFYGPGGFTVADAYLYIILSWSQYVGVDLARFPAIAEYNKAVEAIPEVGAARGAMFAAAPKA